MENATKALIIIGSILITIGIIWIIVFLFDKGRAFPRATVSREEMRLIEAYNAKFAIFESDDIDTIPDDDYRLVASQKLKNIAEVVSAVNLAVDVNTSNNSDYLLDAVETVNAMEIIIDFGATANISGVTNLTGVAGRQRFYLIEPNRNVENNFVYSQGNTLGASREARISGFNTTNRVSCYKLLRELAETKMVRRNNNVYTIYRYYFKGEITVDENTTKVSSVRFTLIDDTAGYNAMD